MMVINNADQPKPGNTAFQFLLASLPLKAYDTHGPIFNDFSEPIHTCNRDLKTSVNKISIPKRGVVELVLEIQRQMHGYPVEREKRIVLQNGPL